MIGDPVPGAEVYIEQEPNDEPVANIVTDNSGNFSFEFPKGMKLPEKVTLKLTIKPPRGVKLQLDSGKTNIVRVVVDTRSGSRHSGRLVWEETACGVTGSKGGFAVGGFSLS